MEPNEWWRFLSRLELLCRQSTLDHFAYNVIHMVAKKAASNSKHGGIVMVPVPKLRTIQQDAPLRVLFTTLDKISLRKITMRLSPKYSVSKESRNKEEDDKHKLNSKIRLIGEDTIKIMPHSSLLIDSLNPHGNFEESPKEFKNRISMLAYSHLMKCLGALFGQFVIEVSKDEIAATFLSLIFVRLVYYFDLHFSCNTFYFGKVSSFLLDFLQD